MEAAAPRGPSIHGLGFAAVAASLLAAAAVLPLDRPPLSLFACPLRAATGWPCLFCGCSHAFHHLVRVELGAAFLASPLGALLAIACVAQVTVTALRLAGVRLSLPEPSLSNRSRLAIAALLALNWAFVAARVRGAL